MLLYHQVNKQVNRYATLPPSKQTGLADMPLHHHVNKQVEQVYMNELTPKSSVLEYFKG